MTCPKCGQEDHGQTGEYPCYVCGLPLVHDSQKRVLLAHERPEMIYISGPMSGIKDYNFPAFMAEAERLRRQGLNVCNPADHGVVEGATWSDYLRYDLAQLMQCTRIHLLPGWENSKGAQFEVLVADKLGLEISYADGAISVCQHQILD